MRDAGRAGRARSPDPDTGGRARPDRACPIQRRRFHRRRRDGRTRWPALRERRGDGPPDLDARRQRLRTRPVQRLRERTRPRSRSTPTRSACGSGTSRRVAASAKPRSRTCRARPTAKRSTVSRSSVPTASTSTCRRASASRAVRADDLEPVAYVPVPGSLHREPARARPRERRRHRRRDGRPDRPGRHGGFEGGRGRSLGRPVVPRVGRGEPRRLAGGGVPRVLVPARVVRRAHAPADRQALPRRRLPLRPDVHAGTVDTSRPTVCSSASTTGTSTPTSGRSKRASRRAATSPCEEWRTFIGADVPYAATCPRWPGADGTGSAD